MFQFKLSSLCIAITVAAGLFGVTRWVLANRDPAAFLGCLLFPVFPVLIALAIWAGIAISDKAEDVAYQGSLTGEDPWWLLRPMLGLVWACARVTLVVAKLILFGLPGFIIGILLLLALVEFLNSLVE